MSNITIIKPGLGYVYGKEVIIETGVVSTTEISDTKQRYKVVAIGGFTPEVLKVISDLTINDASEVYKKEYPGFKVGDVVIIQKHAAEGDSPPEMLSSGYALFLVSRVMAIETDGAKTKQGAV